MKRILVTTIRRGRPLEDSGRAYVVDWATKKVVDQCSMLPVNARFPRNPRGGIRGLRGCLTYKVREKILVMIATNDTISILDEHLNSIDSTIHNRFFCNLHDIVKEGSNIYAVSCGIDAVVNIYNESETVPLYDCKVLSYSGCTRFDHMDRHGVLRPNSLAFYKGEKVVSYAGDNTIKIGQGRDLQIISSEKTITPHSLVIKGDTLYFTSAQNRTVVTMDILNGHTFNIFEDKRPALFRDTKLTRWGWLRGMAITKNILFVGSSPYARVLSMCPRYGIKKDEIKLSSLKSEAVSAITLFPGDWE